MMHRIIGLILILICVISCQRNMPEIEEVDIPTDAVDIFDFMSRTTHRGTLSLYAADREQYSLFESKLNGEIVDLFSAVTLADAGYYELDLHARTDQAEIDELYQFVIVDEDRGESEWGMKKFTPTAFQERIFPLSEIQFLYPKRYPTDLALPIIFKANAPEAELSTYYSDLTVDDKPTTIKRGSGSIMLGLNRTQNLIEVNLAGDILGLDMIDTNPSYTALSGVIDSDVMLAEDGYYHIVADLIVSRNVTLTIPKGCIIKVDEAVNVYSEGSVVIEGTELEPVVFTCSDVKAYWGGFISTGIGNVIQVKHAIFSRSGYHDQGSYVYGHAQRQALFYLDQSQLTMDYTYIIDNIGQIFYPTNQAILVIENTLIQRAKTAGEIVNSDIEIHHSTFTDFPEYSDRFMDEDNDCLYLNQSDAIIIHSAFMWAKDDGIDSGAGGGGEVEISNCWFEGIFHEAIALSSQGTVVKNHNISNSTFINNGQAIELGYSSTNHKVVVGNCHFEKNMIGIRYGDNYDWSVNGQMEITNYSFSDNIDRDIWNFVRSTWAAKDENLIY